MIRYFGGGKYAEFDGLMFCRDDHTGYYLNSTKGIRLHRYVYEKMFGTIPEGYEIHHIDHDKSNNNPENLELLLTEEHRRRHADEMTEEHRQRLRENMLDKAIPAAAQWHKSEAGKEWHRIHYEHHKDKLHKTTELTCKCCGKKYTGLDNGKARFCSNACKSAWRRKEGLDDERRKCFICGAEFTTNKYSSAKCCSRSCSQIMRHKSEKDNQKTA